MAEPRQEFGYRKIVLYKTQTLGIGSYGGVCKAKCDGLLCAAKIIHHTLFDLNDPETALYLRKFEEECHLLSLARHPNIVQYLGAYCDPETHLPVLLMELCDESLCRFLERSVGPLPYHTELNISHDIALALVYLHTNGLIHRDLTGNNVLMFAGIRAKVTDFGMSKLATVNPRMTPPTLCPGNQQYMSPEALEEPPSYTEKLDIFSFGVLLVQIMTRQFPDPGPRFQVIDVPDDPRFPGGTVRVSVPETERRSAHLQLISSIHPLKAIALSCLKGKESERPSAQLLSNTLSELKQASQYAEGIQQAQASEGSGQELTSLRRQVHDLQQREQEQRQENEQLHQQLQQSTAQVYQLQEQLQGQRLLTETKWRENQQLQNTIEEKERIIESTMQTKEKELQEKNDIIQIREAELQASETLVAEFQQNIEQKDRTIRDLQQTISAFESKIQRPEQQMRASSDQLQQPPVTAEVPQATATTAQKDITRLRWQEGRRAPEVMDRGTAVVDGNTVYINSDGSHKVHSCQITSEGLVWSTLPLSHCEYFSLAVVDGLLTCVGGRSGEYGGPSSNTLQSLTGEGSKRQWSEIFPPMPTARYQTASVTTEQALIVAGGCDGGKILNTVEVMSIPAKQWTTAQHLPHLFARSSGIICGDQLYLCGGFVGISEASTSVLTCSLTDLLSPQSLDDSLYTSSLTTKPLVWREIEKLPVTRSTLDTLGGHLLAIGGRNDTHSPTADVHCYDSKTDSWSVVTKMKSKRDLCLSAVLPEDQLLVVGGGLNVESETSVEIGSLPIN